MLQSGIGDTQLQNIATWSNFNKVLIDNKKDTGRQR